jgi:hypothetical protein
VFLFAAAVGPAHADVLFSVELVATSETSTENTGASARLDFDFIVGMNGDSLSLTASNTTPAQIGASLTAFALEWPGQLPDPVYASGGTSTYFDQVHYDVDVNPGWVNAPQGYDALFTSDGNFEGGSPQGAPRDGQSQTIQVELGATGLSAEQLAELFRDTYDTASVPWAAARFQSVGPSGELSDKVIVPEPATLALLGLSGLAITRRRH